MKNNMYMLMLCSAFVLGMDAPISQPLTSEPVTAEELDLFRAEWQAEIGAKKEARDKKNNIGYIVCRAIEIDQTEKGQFKKYKKKQAAIRFLAALPYYQSVKQYTDEAATESDSESVFFEDLTKEQRREKVVARAKEKYIKDLETAKKRYGHHLTGQIEAELQEVPGEQRTELHDEIINQHYYGNRGFNNLAFDNGYAGDNESAIMQTIIKFKARKKTVKP